MFESTFDVVCSLIEEWTPKKQYKKEEGYRDDLYEFLRRKLKSREQNGFGFGEEKYIVQKEAGRHLADIAVNEKIGIELKVNFKRQSQKDRLVGQIKRFLRSYSSVMVVLCGEVDEGKVDELYNDFKDFQPSFGILQPEKIVKIICKTKGRKIKKKPQGLFDISL